MARNAFGVVLFSAILALFAPSSANAQVYAAAELTEAPRIESPSQAVRAIQKSYPAFLRDAGLGGRVQLAFVVRADGSVDPTSVRVLSEERDGLGDAARKAITEIRFKPGKKNGEPVAAEVTIPIAYGAA